MIRNPVRTWREKRRASRRWREAFERLREPKTVEDLTLDEPSLHAELEASPIRIERMRIDVAGFQNWLKRAEYPRRHADYYPHNRTEKALEHYVAAQLLDMSVDEIYIDIASQNGVAAEIYHRLYGVESWTQDLDFPPGVHNRRIGGDAGAMPAPDNFADAMGLHCSFEHFEGDADTRFIREAGRVLKPGGRVVIAPLYIANHYACLTDPEIAARESVEFEPDMKLHAMRQYNNRHGRFYDVPHLIERVWRHRRKMEMRIYIVENFHEVDPSCYLRFAAALRKPHRG